MVDSSGSHTPLPPAALVENRISEKRLFEARFLFDKFSRDIDPALGGQLQQRLTVGISKAEKAFNAGEQAEREADFEKARLAYVEVAALAIDYPGLAEVQQRVELSLQLGSLLLPKSFGETSPSDHFNPPPPDRSTVESDVHVAVGRVSSQPLKVFYLLSSALLGMLGLVVAWIYFNPVNLLDLAGRFIPVLAANRSGESGSERSLASPVGEQMTTLSAMKQVAPASPLSGLSSLEKLPEKEHVIPQQEPEDTSEDAHQDNVLERSSQPVQSVVSEENLEHLRGEIQQSIIPPLVPVFEPEEQLFLSAGVSENSVTPIQNSWKKSLGLQKQKVFVKEKKDEVQENIFLESSEAIPAYLKDGGYNDDYESDRTCSEAVGLSLESQRIGSQKVGDKETTQTPFLQDVPSLQDSWKEIIFVRPGKHVKKKNASISPNVFLNNDASNGTVGIVMDDIVSDPEVQKERRRTSENLVSGEAAPEATEKYIVCSGDTLETISSKVYGDPYKWSYLVMANLDKLGSRPYVLPVGLELDVPFLEKKRGTDLLNDDGTYTVQPGDSLGSIARKIYGNGKEWNSLYRLNRDRLSSPGSLAPGLLLRVNTEHLMRRTTDQSSKE